MTEVELRPSLPVHLVDYIVAKMPFRAIFEARCLSKSWRAKLSSIVSQEDETKKPAAAAFQKLVAVSSRKWKTFCPVLINTQSDLLRYNTETQVWQRLPPLSFVPKHLFAFRNCGTLKELFSTRLELQMARLLLPTF
jgi:hypothetical protein